MRLAPPLVAVLAAWSTTCDAQPLFRDATATHLPPAASVSRNSMDVEAADLDGDGDLDLVVPQEFARNKLLLNDGAGHFTDGSAGLPFPPASERVVPPGGSPVLANGHDSEDVSIADFDGDGVLDVVIVSEDDVQLGRANVHEYHRGLGDATFVRVYGELPDTEANAVAHADLTGDGRPDLLIAGAGQDRLLINDGAGGFTDETAARLPQENAVGQDAEFVDVDADGDLDLVVGNEGGHRLWVNTGGGSFVDETASRLPAPGDVEARKVTPVDVDADGDPDLYFSHVGWEGRLPQDRLLLNDGAGHFSDATADRVPAEALTTLDAKFADLDGDGDLDLVRVDIDRLRVLLNDGAGRFTDATATVLPAAVTGPGLGVEIADFDGDGEPDLYVAMLRNAAPSAFDRLLLHAAAGTGAEGGTPRDPGLLLEWVGSYPNPTASTVTLVYALGRPVPVDVVVVDVLGREVAVVLDGERRAGERTVRVDTSGWPAGVYVVRAEASGHRVTSRLVVAR
jgi:hypothetical protein